MKCEFCHNAEAQTAVTAYVDGVKKELYVCNACANLLGDSKPKKKRGKGGSKDSSSMAEIMADLDDMPEGVLRISGNVNDLPEEFSGLKEALENMPEGVSDLPEDIPGLPEGIEGKVMKIGGGGNPPPPFIKDFLKSALGFMNDMNRAEKTRKKVCPQCGAKWKSLKESEHIRCPECWKTFASEIRDTFLGSQYGVVHKGGSPAVIATGSKRDALAALKRDLKKAIAVEDFRLAAKLKKQIDSFGGRE